MAKKKENEPKDPEKDRTKKAESDKQSQDSPLAFLEQIATLFKLRLLKDKLGVDAVDQNKLNELQTKLGGGADEKSEAEAEIGKIYRQVVEVDQATFHKEVTLEDSLQKAAIKDDELLGRARQMDARMQDLRNKGSEATTQAEVTASISDLNEIAEKLGLDIQVDREKIDRVVHQEVGKLHQLRDEIQLAKQRDEIREVGIGLGVRVKRDKKDEILKEEDFKDAPEDEKRVMRVKRGSQQHQKDADQFIADLKRDFEGDQLDRTDEEHLAEGFLKSKAQNRQRLRYGDGFEGIARADEFTLKAGLIYSDRLLDQIVKRSLKGIPAGARRDMLELQVRAMATDGIREAWTSKRKDLTPESVIGIIEQKLQEGFSGRQNPNTNDIDETMRRRSLKTAESEGDGQYFVEEDMFPGPDGVMMGQKRRRKGKGDDGQLAALMEKGVDMERISIAFSEKKREFDQRAGKVTGKEHVNEFSREFMEDLNKMYPDLSVEDRVYLLGQAEGLFGNEHYLFLRERIRHNDYEGYLKYLMSYLYKVGLREGQQDFQLQAMMREARTILASVGRNDLLAIYKAFEKTAVFHEAYFQLDREGYAKILNSWGVEPLQVFKNKEANSLNVKVTDLEGKKLNDLGIIKYDDLMQGGTWAHRLLYGDKGEIYDEEKVYDDMLVTLLYGGEDQACRIRGTKVVNLVTGAEVADLKDGLIVDGRQMSLESLIQDSRYMAGIAHDMWRLDGRIANVLDDVQVGGAVGANKELLTTWKIRRYAEEYGFVPTWMLEALSLDNFIYEIENYKDLVGAGMKKLFKGKGSNVEEVAQLINDHLKRRRNLRGEEFRTNYLPVEDVRLLSRKGMTWDEAKQEYLRRERLKGNIIDGSGLSENDKDGYGKQITLLHKKWSTNLFTTSERATIDGVDWKRVNAEYAEIMGVEKIGDTFEDFIKNFSFGRLSATEKFRGTDLKDYGGYFLKSGAVVDIFKSGFAGGATEAIAKIFGTMEGYLPYDSSGLRRFIIKEMEVMYSWDDEKWSVEVPKEKVKKGPNGELVDGNMDGKLLPNGEMMMDENGYWVSEMTTKKLNRGLLKDSLLGKTRMRKSRNERDIEYAAYSMVGSGTIDRDTVEEFLDMKYGGWLKNVKTKDLKIKIGGKEVVIIKGSRVFARSWRWLKRWLTLDDPMILFEAAWEDGKKAAGGFFKYVFG